MSYSLVDLVLKSSVTDPTEAAVLVALASFADEYCSCYPSTQALCERSRYKDRAVQGAVKRLEARGILSVKIGRGRGGANFYTIHPSALKPAADAGINDDKTRSKRGYKGEENPHLTTLKPASDDIKPAADADEYVKEPVRNQSTTAREASRQDVVGDETQSRIKRRNEVLSLMGLDGSGVTPRGRFTGTTNDQQEIPKWDDLGLSHAEQDAKIREMLAKQRIKDPGFIPNTWRWFTAGMAELAAAKRRPAAPIRQDAPQAETPEQRRKRRARMIGG